MLGSLNDLFTLSLGNTGALRALVPRVLTGPQPAAGATFVHVVPGNQWERLIAVTFKLTTSAVVANRVPIIQFKDADGNEFCTVASPGVVAAGANQTVTFGRGMVSSQSTQNSRVSTGLPDMTLYPGLSWTLNATGIDAGDQISAIAFFVNEFEVGAAQGMNLGVFERYSQ